MIIKSIGDLKYCSVEERIAFYCRALEIYGYQVVAPNDIQNEPKSEAQGIKERLDKAIN